MLNIKRVIASAPKKPTSVALQPLTTPWSEQATSEDNTFSNHPHPQFERKNFYSLDGWWSYAVVPSENVKREWRMTPIPTEWDGRIRVPFSPEAPLSEVNKQLKPHELLWYKRSFSCPTELYASPDNRCILHFEAVDYACACYCNGMLIGTHIGGYLPFSFDITEMLTQGENEVALCVFDPSDEGVQLRGKQKLERGGIWYTAQSGIWQTVWLEIVPESHIDSLVIETQSDDGILILKVIVCGCDCAAQAKIPLIVKLSDNDGGVYTLSSEADEGIASHSANQLTSAHTFTFDVANPHRWSPDDPYLYHLELTFGNDTVTSYCAFRTITMEEDAQGVTRLCLNHEPYFLRGVLDQGYWPDGLMTAPSDEALIFDIEEMKNLGFNMLRKHIKIESDRWYYHCDRLGMLVWQDMVSGGSVPKSWYVSYKPTFFRCSWGRYIDTPRHYRNLASESNAYRSEWTKTCADTISYLGNHPSIITWVLFNEAWGQFEARKATNMVRHLDHTRPIDAVSGWYDQVCGDFLSVHNYFRPLEVYEDTAFPKRAFIISEFGGPSYHLHEHSSLATSYGYESYSDIGSFRSAVQKIIAQADDLEQQGLAGFVYTQLSDVEEETNGLLTYDRRVNKISEEDRL